MQLNDVGIKRQNEILGRRAVIVAGATAFALAVVKFAAGLIGGSVAVLSSAIDSMLDLLVSALNFFAIRKSQAAPNAKFNFGYAKLEALAAMFEGVLIVGAGAFIFYESVRKLQTEQAPVDTAFSLYAMALSVTVTGLLVAYLSPRPRLGRGLPQGHLAGHHQGGRRRRRRDQGRAQEHRVDLRDPDRIAAGPRRPGGRLDAGQEEG